MSSIVGELYIVATPIGNLQDISYRAVELLGGVDLILVEDTRNAVKLLQHYGIRKPLKALHEHNEEALTAKLVSQLQRGSQIALISDAGTPLMSDPGYRLVKAAQLAGIQALCVPGACAAIAALSIAGLATDRFVFEGFLPAKAAAREQRFSALLSEPRTLIFYEAKHRILSFLMSMLTVFGESRQLVVARELTKKFETVYQGPLVQVLRDIADNDQAQKGEFVVLLEGSKEVHLELDLDKVLRPLLAELSVSSASKLAAKISGLNKNHCYRRALLLQQGECKGN